jgi:predicted MFS family arabinose efflux permease
VADRRLLLLLLAAAGGVAVGNLYFPQAITPLVAADLGVPVDAAALAVTATQLGYACGNFLLVPLGDRLPNHRLLAGVLTLAGVGLLAAVAAPSLPALVAASAFVGLTTVAAPVIGPLAAGLVTEDRRGAVSGLVLSGAIGGILLGRLAGGALGEWLGWRVPYLVAAVLTLSMALVLARAVPVTVPTTRQRYPALLAEPVRLLRREPDLRRSCLNQACVFAAFSATWTALPQLLTGPDHGLGTPVLGTLGLVSVVTMVCTPLAGRIADRVGPDPVNLVCLAGTVVSAVVLAAGDLGGTAGLVAVVAGVLLLDVTMQSGATANVTRIYALGSDRRGRLSTAYMTCAFLGSSAGSWLGAELCAELGWPAVCAFVAVTAAIPLARQRGRVNLLCGTTAIGTSSTRNSGSTSPGTWTSTLAGAVSGAKCRDRTRWITGRSARSRK